MDSPAFVENGQSPLVNEREVVELVETELKVGVEEDGSTPRLQNADCIGDNSGEQHDDLPAC